jgi:hypothetical protein
VPVDCQNQAGVTGLRRTRAESEQIAAEFAGSGLNRTEFCRRQRMSWGTLNRYLKGLGEHGAQGAANGGLVAVELAGAKWATDRDSGSGLALVLARGRKIEVGAGFHAPTLQRLIHLLENL